MRRYVYCPSNDYLDDASILSKQTSLPILVGENSDTQNLNFDREKISVIKIPEYRFVQLSDKKVKQGFHQTIQYMNEYSKLKNNITLYVNQEKIPSFFEEMHFVKFNFLCPNVGKYVCIITVSGQKEEEFTFDID